MQHCYHFIEGYNKEVKWEDYFNCKIFLESEVEHKDAIPMIGEKKYWIIFPKDDYYFVSDSSNIEDIGKKWNFEKHCCE